jgi:hypothetical protein
MPKFSHERTKGEPPEFPQAGLVPGAAVSIPRNSWECGATTTHARVTLRGLTATRPCAARSILVRSLSTHGHAQDRQRWRGTYGMFAVLGAVNSPRRAAPDPGRGRTERCLLHNQRIGKRAHGHTDLRKVPATLPFPYPVAESGAQSRSIGAYRSSKASGLLGDKTTATRLRIRSSPQVITATLGSLGASSRFQWLERKRKRERELYRAPGAGREYYFSDGYHLRDGVRAAAGQHG